MEEFYEAIEERISQAGYRGIVDGEEIYDEISDEIEDKENGEYVLMSKQEDDRYMEYYVTVLDEEFDLKRIVIHDNDDEWIVEMDE